MNRILWLLAGPELVLAGLTGFVFWYCGRHDSGVGRDVVLMEKLVLLLPLLFVPSAFATLFIPGAKTWWWLTRAILVTYTLLFVCAGRGIAGFGEGAKGQDAAFLLVLIFGTILIALGTAVAGAVILAETRPGFAAWFGARKILGSFIILLASVPLALGLGVIASAGVAIGASAYSALKH